MDSAANRNPNYIPPSQGSGTTLLCGQWSTKWQSAHLVVSISATIGKYFTPEAKTTWWIGSLRWLVTALSPSAWSHLCWVGAEGCWDYTWAGAWRSTAKPLPVETRNTSEMNWSEAALESRYETAWRPFEEQMNSLCKVFVALKCKSSWNLMKKTQRPLY